MELNKNIYILNKELSIENEVLMQNMEKKNNKIKELENCIDILKKEKNFLQQEYDKIIYSRSYKIIQNLKKIIKN